MRDQVRRRKDAFIARLQRQLRNVGRCIVSISTADHNGYPRMGFKFQGRHVNIHVMRVIAILRNFGPIPEGYEVAHIEGCAVRACVYHTELQHYSRNAVTDPKGENLK